MQVQMQEQQADEFMKLTIRESMTQVLIATIACILMGSIAFFTAMTGMIVAVGEPVITSGIILGLFLIICAILLSPVVSYFYNIHIENMGMERKNRVVFILIMNMFSITVTVVEFMWVWTL